MLMGRSSTRAVSYLCPRQLGYGAASFGMMGQILIGPNVLNRLPHAV